MKIGSRHYTIFASILGQVFALARNVVVARLLGPEQFGLAAAIILTITFLESFSAASAHNLLVQAKEDDDRLLSSYHAISSSRGALTAVFLALLAWPVATVDGFAGIQNALYIVAGSSFVAGFAHGGVKYAQRFGDFRRDAATQIAADLASLVVAAAVAIATKSHVAIAYGLLARSVTLVLISHLLAGRRYEIAWSRSHMQKFWAFGWPLLINGPLLFLSAQAERVFISFELGAAALGVYSATMLLIMSPASALLRALGTISIPLLAKQFHTFGALRPEGATYNYTAAMVTLALMMFAGFACFGRDIVSVLYGHRYQAPVDLVVLVGALQVIRFLRAWPSTLALSAAANRGILLSSAVRLVALPAGYAGLMLGGGLSGLIAGFAVGEFVALSIGLATVNRSVGRSVATGMRTIAALAVICGVTSWMVLTAEGHFTVLASVFVAAIVVGAPLVALSVSKPQTLALLRKARRRT